MKTMLFSLIFLFAGTTVRAVDSDFCEGAALDKGERQAKVDSQDTTDCEAVSATLMKRSSNCSLYRVVVKCDMIPGYVYEVMTRVGVIHGKFKVCKATQIRHAGRI